MVKKMSKKRLLGELLDMSAEQFNRLLKEEAGDIIRDYIKEDIERSVRTLRYARQTRVSNEYH